MRKIYIPFKHKILLHDVVIMCLKHHRENGGEGKIT